uniref:Uncharacterized protein n=1 Tax=Eutreptiella gymnastica TaxID=73025 RepID=A0A7S1INM3_9EUGL
MSLLSGSAHPQYYTETLATTTETSGAKKAIMASAAIGASVAVLLFAVTTTSSANPAGLYTVPASAARGITPSYTTVTGQLVGGTALGSTADASFMGQGIIAATSSVASFLQMTQAHVAAVQAKIASSIAMLPPAVGFAVKAVLVVGAFIWALGAVTALVWAVYRLVDRLTGSRRSEETNSQRALAMQASSAFTDTFEEVDQVAEQATLQLVRAEKAAQQAEELRGKEELTPRTAALMETLEQVQEMKKAMAETQRLVQIMKAEKQQAGLDAIQQNGLAIDALVEAEAAKNPRVVLKQTRQQLQQLRKTVDITNNQLKSALAEKAGITKRKYPENFKSWADGLKTTPMISTAERAPANSEYRAAMADWVATVSIDDVHTTVERNPQAEQYRTNFGSWQDRIKAGGSVDAFVEAKPVQTQYTLKETAHQVIEMKKAMKQTKRLVKAVKALKARKAGAVDEAEFERLKAAVAAASSLYGVRDPTVQARMEVLQRAVEERKGKKSLPIATDSAAAAVAIAVRGNLQTDSDWEMMKYGVEYL